MKNMYCSANSLFKKRSIQIFMEILLIKILTEISFAKLLLEFNLIASSFEWKKSAKCKNCHKS